MVVSLTSETAFAKPCSVFVHQAGTTAKKTDGTDITVQSDNGDVAIRVFRYGDREGEITDPTSMTSTTDGTSVNVTVSSNWTKAVAPNPAQETLGVRGYHLSSLSVPSTGGPWKLHFGWMVPEKKDDGTFKVVQCNRTVTVTVVPKPDSATAGITTPDGPDKADPKYEDLLPCQLGLGGSFGFNDEVQKGNAYGADLFAACKPFKYMRLGGRFGYRNSEVHVNPNLSRTNKSITENIWLMTGRVVGVIPFITNRLELDLGVDLGYLHLNRDDGLLSELGTGLTFRDKVNTGSFVVGPVASLVGMIHRNIGASFTFSMPVAPKLPRVPGAAAVSGAQQAPVAGTYLFPTLSLNLVLQADLFSGSSSSTTRVAGRNR